MSEPKKEGIFKSFKNLPYGGSVNTKNALQLFALESVDGGLIGRASLDVGEFVSICKAATPNTY